ncbi:MAG: ABC transporter permease [Planctomycetota bacterium]
MNTFKLMWRELQHRKSQLISGLLAITLGIAVIVAIQSVTDVSERAVAINLDNLGSNVLVLPQAATVDDYYAADIDAPTMPEDYVERILTTSLPGVDNLSPKLTRRVKGGNERIVLTGILPSKEIASKPMWQTAGLVGDDLQRTCDPNSQANASQGYEDPRLQRKAVKDLGESECLVGSSAAERLGVAEDGTLDVEGKTLTVVRVLPETGTVDDDRVFAHLHTVQSMLGIPAQVSAIEIMGCCNAISDGLLTKLRNILPDTRITTVSQIVSTQIETNQLMRKVSWTFLVIVLVVGGVSIGNYLWGNVNERRKEIGILRMIGASKGTIYALLLGKAVLLGVLGGILGWILGTGAGMILGPQFVGFSVDPVPAYLFWAVLLSVGVALVGSLIPAALAARIEPFSNMQEV